MSTNQSHTEVITLNLFTESGSDNKVNEHLCSQKNVLFSVNVAKKFDYAFSRFYHQLCSPAWSSTSDDTCAFQPHGNRLGGEINVGSANEMHVKRFRDMLAARCC